MMNKKDQRNALMIEKWLETDCTLKSIAKENNISACTVDYSIRSFIESRMPDVSKRFKEETGRYLMGMNQWLKENRDFVLAEIRSRFSVEINEKAAVKIAADKRGITTMEWMVEAIKEKLEREKS